MKFRLQYRYAIMFGAVALVVSVLVATLVLQLARGTSRDLNHTNFRASVDSLMGEFEARGRSTVALIAHSLVEAMYFEDLPVIRTLTRSSLGLPDVSAIQVFDREGNVLDDGTNHLTRFGTTVAPELRREVVSGSGWYREDDKDRLVLAGPIRLGNYVLGGVALTLDKTRISGEVQAQHTRVRQVARDHIAGMARSVAMMLPVVLALSILVGIIAARRMVHPIQRLRAAAVSVSRGNFAIDWPEPRKDELGELADAMRQMVRQIQTQTVSTTYLDDVIGSMFDCLVVTDSEQRIEKVNAATCRLTGYSPSELMGQPFARLLSPPGAADDAPELPPEGASFDTVYDRTGKAIPVEMGSATMASHVDGRPRTVTVFRDVSEQRARERELRQAKEEAEVANASKSQFLANMSHELRTPLNAIIGFSSMIKDEIKGPLSDVYKSYAGDIHDSAMHLLSIINDILDLSKLEAGKMDFLEEQVDLGEILQSVLRITRQRADERLITITTEIPEDLPDLLVDQRMMKQILINLISNAIKFNRTGGRVTVTAGVNPEGGLSLAVIDTGIGMAEKDIPRLLEPFSQADAALNRTYEGTGLGLAITRNMVDLHSGRMEVKSELGRGTTVTIQLPPSRVAAAPVAMDSGTREDADEQG